MQKSKEAVEVFNFKGSFEDKSKQPHPVRQPSTHLCSENIARRKFHPTAINYILAYLEIGYIFCFIPFTCKFNRETGIYEIVEFFPQKCLTLIFHTFQTTYNAIWYFCLLIKLNYTNSPIKSFTRCETLIDISYLFIFSHMLIFKKSCFQHFFKIAQKHYSFVGSEPEYKKIVIKANIFFVYVIFGTLYMWFSVVTAPINSTEKLSRFMLPHNETASWILSIINVRSNSSILSVLLSFWRAMGESISVLLFAFGWYLKQICEDLCVIITSLERSCIEILQQYEQIKNINGIMTSITKYIMFLYIIGSLPFVSDSIMDFSLSEPRIIIKLIYVGTGFLISMLGSAEANSTANQLKHALTERHILKMEQTSESVSLQMLLSEFSTPEIGLKGMHFFIVTYGFVGVMLSQCIVYALVILQLRGPSLPILA